MKPTSKEYNLHAPRVEEDSIALKEERFVSRENKIY
jgi:hypothetical protein